jgi:CDGSH-type Zn-finger protein/truncated hemoglobin YjbI
VNRTGTPIDDSRLRLLADQVHRQAAAAGGEDGLLVGDRLLRSVLRPLEPPETDAKPEADAGLSGPLADQVAELAVLATQGYLAQPSQGMHEAAAALHDLVARIAPDRVQELAGLVASLPQSVVVVSRGPYLTANAPLADWLDVEISPRPLAALCRCGQSQLKPFCDGTHAEIDFDDAKSPTRVPDRRDRYDGVQVTVLDNRGLCAHSGFCTDRLKSAFHADSEPFVTPSGGRADELIKAVRACPSGALSYALDGVEQRDRVDQQRPPKVEVSKDGPYRITGGIQLLDEAGAPVERNEGASLEHYSLCRCGKSQNKPFCSGMHWYADFHDPALPDDREPTLFEWAGGFPALERMTHIFYEKYVPEEPLLAPLFASMSPDHPRRVAAWLGEVFGGPKRYSEQYGDYDRMVSQHIGKAIGEEQRAAWVRLLCRSADDAQLPADPEFRAAFVAYLEWGSRIAKENATVGAHPPPHLPVPRWWWVCDAYPDARTSALAPQPEEEETPVALPGENETVGFAAHIKPLFREQDRGAMRWAFDLWSYEDVSEHGEAIGARLEAGTMPCDGAWPGEQVAVFKRWLEGGKAA